MECMSYVSLKGVNKVITGKDRKRNLGLQLENATKVNTVEKRNRSCQDFGHKITIKQNK